VPDIESPATLSPAPSQASFTLLLHQGARVSLLSASDLRNKARLQSLTLSQAHAWLLAVPCKPSLQLKPVEFRQDTRYCLGIADHNEEQVGPVCRKCKRSQDPQDAGFVYGDHSTQCHGGGSLHRRHDRLKVVLYAALRSGGYSPQLEPPHLIPGRLTRPEDLRPVGDNGLGVAYDLTVVSPLLGHTLASTARTPGHAVTAAEQRKASLYTSVCDAVDIRFIPLAQETFGGMSGMASPRFASLRTAKRTALEHPALCAGTPCSVHFQLPPKGASLGILLTGPVDSPKMPPFCPVDQASVPFRVSSCFKDLSILCFRLNKK
jgi:hypothetical protein